MNTLRVVVLALAAAALIGQGVLHAAAEYSEKSGGKICKTNFTPKNMNAKICPLTT